MPKSFVARLWVDVKIQAENEEEAKKILMALPVEVKKTETAEVYDIQLSGQVWDASE